MLSEKKIEMALYLLLLLASMYMITTTGNNPGFENKSEISKENVEGEIGGLLEDSSYDYCDICNCKQKMRTKHCFRCGKCVRKFDHHCPWIGACVGESNHCRFCVMVLLLTVHAIASFIVVSLR
jgi:palmitoyltransferase